MIRAATKIALIALLVLFSPSRAGGPFLHETFSGEGTVEETWKIGRSASERWWLNSGGWFRWSDGRARTVQGELPPDDPWRKRYEKSNALDTDGGRHPQNIFRLVTRKTFGDFAQELRFRIERLNRSETPNRGGHSGVLLFVRYQNGDNLYYLGLRQDGSAVIKRKRNGRYETLISRKVYPGEYDRERSPNCLPEGRWLRMRSVVRTLPSGNVWLALDLAPDEDGELPDVAGAKRIGDWLRILQIEDSSPLRLRKPGHAGIRGDYLDLSFSDYRIGEVSGLAPTHAVSLPLEAIEPAAKRWLIDGNLDGQIDLELSFDRPVSIPVPGDYDADGIEDHAWFDPASGEWWIDVDVDGIADRQWRLGDSSDVPVPERYASPSRTSAAVFRPRDGTWRIDRDGDGTSDRLFRLGREGDLPAPADYDADGLADPAVFRPSSGTWIVLESGSGRSRVIPFGEPGDLPAPGDFDGDGRDEPAVFRPAEGTWVIDYAADGTPNVTKRYGKRGDVPDVGDYDGDGQDERAVFRPSTATWFVDLDGDEGTELRIRLGEGCFVPVVRNAFRPYESPCVGNGTVLPDSRAGRVAPISLQP